MKRFLSLFMTLAMILAIPAYSLAAKSVKVAMINNESEPNTKALRSVFKDYVEKHSDGKFKVDIYANGSLGATDTIFQGVQFGTIQIAIDSAANLSQFCPELSVMDMPYLMPTYEDLKVVTEGPYKDKMNSYFEKAGVKSVAMFPTSYRSIALRKPAATLEDIQGLKIRSTSSKTHMAAISSLGMTPTPMAPQEIMTGMQQGVIDGTDDDITGFIGDRICDVANTIIVCDYIPVVFCMYVSPDWWESLSDADKAVFDGAFKAYYDAVMHDYAEANEAAWKELEEKYHINLVKQTPEERARWMEKAKSARNSLTDAQKQVANEIEAAVAANKKN